MELASESTREFGDELQHVWDRSNKPLKQGGGPVSVYPL